MYRKHENSSHENINENIRDGPSKADFNANEDSIINKIKIIKLKLTKN